MNTFKQTFKNIKEKGKESEQNTRRISENFPLIERKLDNIVFDQSFRMHFPLTKHPHNVNLTIHFKPPQNCFQCNPVNPNPPNIFAVAPCPTNFGPGDGNAYPAKYDSLTTNVGGFSLDPNGGIIVPVDGYYTTQFFNNVGGVVVSEQAAVIGSVRHNGVVKMQQVFSVQNGKLSPPLSGLGASFNLTSPCVLMRAGDTTGGWLAAGGIAFYSPGNFCFSPTTVILVGYA